ncbi:MAG: hypothetical protein KDK55_02265 [Chlamydiia bacterium]|nr:hypothetical protein [Chlamydiia bacterium]
MNIIINPLKYASLFLLILCPLLGKEDHRVENQPAAIEEAITLSNQGILKRKDNGFIYLDVSNEFITEIIPLLDHEGMLRARPTASRSIGAHISVFHEMEDITPKELGEAFSFEVKEIRSFTLHTRDGFKKLWVIAVNSPELENLREKYGYSPKLKGFDYHITLGKQMPSAPENWETVEHLSPFNFSDESTEGLFADGDFVTVEHREILATAAKVDAIGQLKLKGNGFVYLDVNNAFIDTIWEQLPLQGEFAPISTKPKKMGAHISVIHEDEMIQQEIWNLAEAGEWFTFAVKELRYVERKTAKGESRLWLLAADSPALERLRMHYGLKPKLKNHDFHITIGSEQTEFSALLDEDYMDIGEFFEFEPAAACAA